jgi:hypothetical protein
VSEASSIHPAGPKVSRTFFSRPRAIDLTDRAPDSGLTTVPTIGGVTRMQEGPTVNHQCNPCSACSRASS